MDCLVLYLVERNSYCSRFLQRSESMVYTDKITMPTTIKMTITVVIKTKNKFLNMTGYCQPNLSDSKTVYASCS